MKSKFLNIEGMEILSKENQKTIFGGAGGNNDLSKCGCSCSGSVTGPFYCHKVIACPQVYTCNQEI